jgi:hypothetical protein
MINPCFANGQLSEIVGAATFAALHKDPLAYVMAEDIEPTDSPKNPYLLHVVMHEVGGCVRADHTLCTVQN